MKNDDRCSDLTEAIESIKEIPPRNDQASRAGRAAFLEEGAKYRSEFTEGEKHPLGESLLALFRTAFFSPAFKPVAALVLAMVLFLGAAATTVYAAQESLPDQALYPVKIWSEDARLSMSVSAQSRLEFALDFSDRRLSEMAGLQAAGESIPESLENRYQTELQMALELAAGMDDPQALQLLVMVHQRAKNQVQPMQQILSGASGSQESLLMRANQRLQEQIRLSALGESNLSGLRDQLRLGLQGKPGMGQSTPAFGTSPNNSGMQTMMPVQDTPVMNATQASGMGTPDQIGPGTSGSGSGGQFGSGSGSGAGSGSGSGSGSGQMGPSDSMVTPGGAQTPDSSGMMPGSGSGIGPEHNP
jgi:uncharacterized membrane protein YgcG